MIDLRSAIQDVMDGARKEALIAAAKTHRFAWAEGHSILYRFMSLSGDGFGYVADILENSRVYFSSPDQLNDPTDCRPVFKLAKDLSDTEFVEELQADEAKMISEKNLTPEQIAELHANFGVKVEALAESVTEHTRLELQRVTRVYCLTVASRNVLMWAHYADKHAGVCLHFESRSGALFGKARGVIYSDKRKPILIPLRYNEGEPDVADQMVFAKASSWCYEKEYRIISHEDIVADYPMKGRFVSFDADQLVGITFGMRISDANRQALTKLIANRKTPMRVFEAVDSEQFTIEFRPTS